MRYKNITVCLDNSAGSSRLFDFSMALAAQNDAHLSGLCLTYAPLILSDPYAVGAAMMLEWEDTAQKKQDQAREKFISKAAKAGVIADFSGYRSTDAREVIAHARASDLAIVAQRNVADCDADLLVISVYGLHRLIELILGGVTKSIMRQMTLPVLMSH